MVAEAGKEFYIRIPLIEGVNADEENITCSAEFLSSLPWNRKTVNLLLYHNIGKGKHEKLGTVYNSGHLAMKVPSDDTVKRCQAIFERFGIQVIIGG